MFRRDILSAQPAKLYRAKMAEFRTPFFRSYLVNDPALVRRVLIDAPKEFPKSERVTRGLNILLGQSVFVTNGSLWERQRRIINPAFEGGRIKDQFPAMLEAAQAAVERVEPGVVDIEAAASHATADVIFRTLFSVPIEYKTASDTYQAFRAFQRSQPVAILSALIPWWPVRHKKRTKETANALRDLIAQLVDARQAQIEDGTAPDDLATKIMTTRDPETGVCFTRSEMIDQVAIFFLAGHETSAALLSWALWCLAASPEHGNQVAQEAKAFMDAPSFANLSKMPLTRDVLKETLRLYPPVPMMVREAASAQTFRKRAIKSGAQIVISLWHLGRHVEAWDDPDTFRPERWEAKPAREAYLPFSAGPRVCPGAAFALSEGAILLAAFMARFEFEVVDTPVPVAHLTTRTRDGMCLNVKVR
ncbi:MAG: cytochrome P450 [Parasphingorhabdus sp.]